MGRWSNFSDQGERLQTLVEILPEGTSKVNVRTPRQVQKRLHAEQVSELLMAYKDGNTVYELAKRFKIHRTTVSFILERHGVSRR
jgi:hypothetical protein